MFTAEVDMRNALHNLQSTFAGLGLIASDNLFKICDQPHPKLIKHLLGQCQKGDVRQALTVIQGVRIGGMFYQMY